MKLGLKASASGFGCDLPERTGVDVQNGIARSRMVQHVVRIHAKRQSFRLADLDGFLDVGMKIPDSRAFNRIQAESAVLSWTCVAEDDIAIRIRKRREGAPLSQIGCDCRACRI